MSATMQPGDGRSTTLVLPALNEGAVIGEVVRALLSCEAIRSAGISDVLVVDNGSTDDTAARATEAGARVVAEPRRGYGRACLAGIRATDADIVVLMDADGSDVPADVLRVWRPVAEGAADLCVGSRTRGACEPGALMPQQRAGNAVGAAVLRAVYGVRVSDIGPLRAIRRHALLRLDMREMTYGWSAEMLAKAGRAGMRVREVPVDYRRRAGGTSKVAGTLSGTVRASVRIVRTLAAYARWSPETQPDAPDEATDAAGVATAALIVVVRVPTPGTTKTRLMPRLGPGGAARLYTAFLADLGARLTTAAMRDGYDLFWCYAAPEGTDESDFARHVPDLPAGGGGYLRQAGGDLAERLWAATSEVARRGYRRVAVLGSDSPHVPAAWIARAFTQLDTCEVALGPAMDGGYYLLAQRVGALHGPDDLFRGIHMSTPTVAAETLARAAALKRTVALLPETFDVDEPDDLERLAAALEGAPSDNADCAPHTLAELAALGIGEGVCTCDDAQRALAAEVAHAADLREGVLDGR